MAAIIINGKTYDLDLLTKEARDKIIMAQVFDKRINELKNDQVMAQIALNTVVLELETMTSGKMITSHPVGTSAPAPAAKITPETKPKMPKKSTTRKKS